MTREEFFTICAGIQYWKNRYSTDKVISLLRMLYHTVHAALKAQELRLAGSEEADDAEEDVRMQYSQVQASIYVPSINDIVDEEDALSDSDIDAFLPKSAIGDASQVTLDDLVAVAIDLMLYGLLVNDPEDTNLASQAIMRAVRDHDSTKSAALIAAHAYVAFMDGNRKQSEELFQHSLEIEPDRAETYLLRSLAFFTSMRYDRALADIERAEILRKNDIMIMSLHGDILFEAKELDESVRLHEAVLQRDPTFRRSLLSLSVINLELSRPEKAYPNLKFLLKSEPLNWFALSCLGDIFLTKQGLTLHAIPYYTMSILAGTNEPLVFLNVVRLLLHSGYYSSAREILVDISHSRDKSVPRRFPKMPHATRYRKEISYLMLICELVLDPEKYMDAPELLKQQLGDIQADRFTRMLFRLLLDYAGLDYADSMEEIIKRSFGGIEMIQECAVNSSNHNVTSNDMVLMVTVIRMAIWNGFYAEARSFLNMLSQLDDPPLLDALTLLENELFEHEAMTRQAHVDLSTFHFQTLDLPGQKIREALVHGKIKGADIPSSWRTLLTSCLGLNRNHDWSGLFLDPSDEAPFATLAKFARDTTFMHMAPRLRNARAYMHDHPEESWDSMKEHLQALLSDGRIFTPASPEMPAMLNYLEYVHAHTREGAAQKPRQSDRLLNERLFSKELELKQACSWIAKNDDRVDMDKLIPDYFITVQRPKYFDDTSLAADECAVSDRVVEIPPDACDLPSFVVEPYASLLARRATNGNVDVGDPEAAKTNLLNALKMLHGQESCRVFQQIHKNSKGYDFIKNTLSQLTTRPDLLEFRLALASWRDPDAPWHMLPREKLPHDYALFRMQTPLEYPRAARELKKPVPGGLVTWLDLRELFHNYVAYAFEEFLSNHHRDPLAVFFDNEIAFTLVSHRNPNEKLNNVDDLVASISDYMQDAAKPNPRILLAFGIGTDISPFCRQFDAWAEHMASALITPCRQIEAAVRHVTPQTAFETRCRIDLLINRYPYLSRLYLLKAAMFAKIGEEQAAIETIDEGLAWENRLYHGVGWFPIHPAQDDPLTETPFEIPEPDENGDLPFRIWNETILDINFENELSYYYSNWEQLHKIRRRIPHKPPRLVQREMTYDKGGAYDFYRLFRFFITDMPHLRNVYLKAVATPGLWNLREYLRFMLFKLDSNESFEFHRQLSELLVQLYPLDDSVPVARFCSDNGFALNAMFHAARTFVTRDLNAEKNSAHDAAEIIGASLYDLGFISDACRLLKLAASNPVPRAQTFLSLGCALIENQKFQQAVDSLQTGLEIEPFNDRHYFNLALALIEQENYEKAESVLKKGIAIARAPFDLGIQYLRLLVRQERFHEAVELSACLNKADHQMFCETMRALEFAQLVQLKPIRAMLDESW